MAIRKKRALPEDGKRRRAKLFTNGRSQAVRLPKEFRFQGSEVLVHREGTAVILESAEKRKWPKGYWARIDRHRKALDLGIVPPLGARLLDVSERKDLEA